MSSTNMLSYKVFCLENRRQWDVSGAHHEVRLKIGGIKGIKSGGVTSWGLTDSFSTSPRFCFENGNIDDREKFEH